MNAFEPALSEVVKVDNKDADVNELEVLYHNLIFVKSDVVTAVPVVVKSTWFIIVAIEVTAVEKVYKMLLVEFFTILAADGCEPLFARTILGHIPVIVPLTAIFCVVTPVDAQVILPL